MKYYLNRELEKVDVSLGKTDSQLKNIANTLPVITKFLTVFLCVRCIVA